MALKTKNRLLKISDIDTIWAFQFYLGLPTGTLTGQDEKISSPFARDSNPSFSIYKSKHSLSGPYRWHCLATGLKGDVVDLVAILRAPDRNIPLPRPQAFRAIKKDFDNFLQGTQDYRPIEHKINTKGKVTAWELRKWSAEDFEWWSQFGISAEILEFFNVAPMGEFKMHKIKNNVEMNMTFNNSKAYGFLTKSGALAKIYQPDQKDAKYIKVQEYLQGFDQLLFNKPNLMILSALKDGMCFHGLNFEEFEILAPDSENVMIPAEVMMMLKEKYPKIYVLMDNDEAGIKATEKYVEMYPWVIPVYLTGMSKDISDSVRDYNQILVKIELIPML